MGSSNGRIKMTDLRKIEIQDGDDWIVKQMKELREGDIFRMTEPDELIPFGTWIATSDAKDGYEGPNGESVWGINTADLVDI